MPDQGDSPQIDIDRYLKRREKEDGLLNTHTILILITNSIAAVAVGQNSAIIKTIVTISMICINLLWIKCSFEAARAIRLYTDEINKNPPPDEKLWEEKIYNKRIILLDPTVIIGKLIPFIILLAWSLGLAISILH